MQASLVKRRLPAYAENRSVEAYANEFLAGMENLWDNIVSGGVIATDTLKVGDKELYYTVRSPLTVKDENGVVDISFGGPTPLNIGIRTTPPQSSPLPAVKWPGATARADKTRTSGT